MFKNLIAVALTALSCAVGAQAKSISGTCGEDAVWRLDDTTLTISGTGAIAEFSSSSTPKWYPYKDKIHNVVVEEGITSIGSFSFYEYQNIESVSLPEGLQRIGNYAFYGCTELARINFPMTLECIGDELVSYTNNGYVFTYCHKLTSINLPENLKLISAGSFNGCSSLTEVYWNAEECEANVSYNNTGDYIGIFVESPVEKVIFGNKVKFISEYSFQDVGSLTYVITSGTIEFVGVNAFMGTEWQKRMSEPGKVLYLDMVAYSFDKSNEFDEYGEGVESYAIDIKPGTKCITDYIFEGCDYLDTVTIPESVENLGNYSFLNCDALKTINWNVVSLLEAHDNYNGGRYFSYLFEVFPKYFNFGNHVESIPDRLLSGCKLVKEVILPESLREIRQRAFEECMALTSLAIPDGVEILGELAVAYCENLEKLTIGEGLKEFNYHYFLIGCPKLTTLEWNAIRTSEKIFDPYHETDRCVAPVENFIVGDKVEYVPGQLFWESKTLNNVVFGKSVIEIGEAAFRSCYSLTHVELPESLIKIADDAFYDNTLQGVIIPENVTDLGIWAFGSGPDLVICCPQVAPYNNSSFFHCGNTVFYVTDVIDYVENYWQQDYEGQVQPIISASTHELSEDIPSPTFSLNVPDYELTYMEDFIPDTTPGDHTAYLRVSCRGKNGDFSATICFRYTYGDPSSVKEVASADENHVEIFNLSGVKIFEGKLKDAHGAIPAGIYVIRDGSGFSKQSIR